MGFNKKKNIIDFCLLVRFHNLFRCCSFYSSLFSSVWMLVFKKKEIHDYNNLVQLLP